jgi:hypothetical protein
VGGALRCAGPLGGMLVGRVVAAMRGLGVAANQLAWGFRTGSWVWGLKRESEQGHWEGSCLGAWCLRG